MKAIIIGSGGAGLAALHAMREHGIDAVAFEQHGELGGVWSTTRYPSLTIHSKSFNYRFHDFPPIDSRGPSATRDEVLAYFHAYVRANGLADRIVYHRRVVRIDYRRAATPRCVVVTDEGAEHPCDLVVCATGFSNAGKPHVPAFAGPPDARVLHSSELTPEILDDIVTHRRSTIVLGAGKSAHEILWLLREVDPLWLYRKGLWSLSYEALYSRWSVAGYLYYLQVAKLRRRLGFTALVGALQAPLRWSGLFVNPLEPDSDICINRSAILRREQLAFLRTVRSRKIERLEALTADYLICATGYDRTAWLPAIRIDGAPHRFTGFYQEMIDPEVPEISVLAANVLYPQQLLGYSLGAQWLARFHTNSLARPGTPVRRPWSTGEYLSNGQPYVHDRGDEALPSVFSQLGLSPHLAHLLVAYGANERRFGALCDRIAGELKASLRCVASPRDSAGMHGSVGSVGFEP